VIWLLVRIISLKRSPNTMLKSIEIESIAEWFTKAVPVPAEKNAQTQIGCHFEEVAEMLETLKSDDPTTNVALKVGVQAMHGLAKLVKERGQLQLRANQQENLLDALCDQIVTAVGVAHMLKYDITGAIEEVNASNWSKFVDGTPVFDENKKIQKGSGYFKPRLKSFITSPN
jgi:hypothetical protein